MIVVVGNAALRTDPDGTGRPAGPAAGIAERAAAAGASVELLAKIGEDGAGEELLLALARAGVGHLAVLRDAGVPTAIAEGGAGPDEDAPIADLVAGTVGGGAPGPAAATTAVLAPAPDLEPADVSLGLHYLRDYRVAVAVEPLAAGCARVVVDAAAFVDAALVVVAAPGVALPEAYGRATVIEAPAEDPDGAFAALVGRYVAALDRGEAADEAFRAATAEGGWEPAAD